MWEVFTCGKMPYGRLKNTEVVERVQRGIILERPKASTKEIYDVSRVGGGWEARIIDHLIEFLSPRSTGHEKVLGTQSRGSSVVPESQGAINTGRTGIDRLIGLSQSSGEGEGRKREGQRREKQWNH